MTEIEQRPNRLPWPPLIYVAAIAASIVLGTLVPLPWLPPPASELLFAIGWVAIAGALAIDVAAMRTLHRSRTTVLPYRGASHLVTGGPYAVSRNPIYLSNTILTAGIGLVAGNAWFLPLALAAAFATGKLAIEREERHLEARFGKRWRDYAKRVRRWI